VPAKLFEAVPNFSEGRDAEKIQRITAAASAVPGVRLLDLHSDADHNRSVLTLVGEEGPLLEASAALARACAREIDLSAQTGEHPRMGSLDVLPFVPLGGASPASMEDAARLARRAGEALGSLGFAVYLYEGAATAPHRRNLADVRRGGYGGVADRARRDPMWSPDFGPAEPSPRLGAVAVGARPPLVAFNAYLDTDDVRVARAVAAEVRGSAGGPPGLKALGLTVGGRAQVSMNLTDLDRTSMLEALEAVRAAAAGRGARVVETELVGMVPLGAILESARRCLLLPEGSLGAERVIEAALWGKAGAVNAMRAESDSGYGTAP
jgi:glutamate formiminotransferase